MYGNAHPGSACARPCHPRRWFGWLLAAFAGLAFAPLMAQDAAPVSVSEDAILHAKVRNRAEALVHEEDPVVRGEAALVLAGLRELQHYDEILGVARDRDPAARLRGTVALGIQAVAGSEAFLGQLLEDSLTRPSPEGMAAALALGLLPEQHPQPHVRSYLMRFRSFSLRRQRDVMTAMLAGLAAEPHPGTTAALVELLEDASNKDGELRAQMLGILLQVPGAMPAGLRDQLLEDGRPEERAMLLRFLAAQRTELERDTIRGLERTVLRDRSAAVRAAALRYLTAIRHLPALELGARAMKSNYPAEAAQGVRTTLLLGGGVMRRAVEDHIRETVKPALVTAMLRVFESPYGDEFTDFLTRMVGDRSRPLALRTTSALSLAEAGVQGVAPALRTLFLENEDPTVLRELVRAMLGLEDNPPDLARLQPTLSLEDAERLPLRLRCLLAGGHPDALPRLVEMLEDPAVSPPIKADLLRAYRMGIQPGLPADQVAALPEPLRPLFR